jgi:hypothetical protein
MDIACSPSPTAELAACLRETGFKERCRTSGRASKAHLRRFECISRAATTGVHESPRCWVGLGDGVLGWHGSCGLRGGDGWREGREDWMLLLQCFLLMMVFGDVIGG